MMKNNILTLGVVVLMAGVVLAIGGASFTQIGNDYRWTGATGVPGDTIEGGNITQGDLNATSLTDRWAAYFGNVSGSIMLGDGSSYVYTWTVSNTSAVGEVCASTGSAYSFAGATAETGADVDTAFGLGSAADNAVATYNDTGVCNLAFDVGSVSTSAYVQHTNGNFWTCAVNDGTGTQTENEMAFCTNISSTGSTAYDGTPAQYELMVPTTPGSATTEVYYFYLELN